MLKNSKVVLFVTLKSWSGRKLLDPTTYILCFACLRRTLTPSVHKAKFIGPKCVGNAPVCVCLCLAEGLQCVEHHYKTSPN